MYVVRVGARGRIGHDDSTVDPKAVTGACSGVARVDLEPPVTEGGHLRFAARFAVLEEEVDLSRGGRPQPEPRAASGGRLRAERHRMPPLHFPLPLRISSASDRASNG